MPHVGKVSCWGFSRSTGWIIHCYSWSDLCILRIRAQFTLVESVSDSVPARVGLHQLPFVTGPVCDFMDRTFRCSHPCSRLSCCSSTLRWFSHLVMMPLGHLSGGTVSGMPNQKEASGQTRRHWRAGEIISLSWPESASMCHWESRKKWLGLVLRLLSWQPRTCHTCQHGS